MHKPTILANSELVVLLKQANTDSARMAEVIGVSEAQLRFVTNSSSGMGLIKFGLAVIPFDNQISEVVVYSETSIQIYWKHSDAYEKILNKINA